eukprot:4638968-Amphidinium_carterae.1
MGIALSLGSDIIFWWQTSISSPLSRDTAPALAHASESDAEDAYIHRCTDQLWQKTPTVGVAGVPNKVTGILTNARKNMMYAKHLCEN